MNQIARQKKSIAELPETLNKKKNNSFRSCLNGFEEEPILCRKLKKFRNLECLLVVAKLSMYSPFVSPY